MMKRLNYTQYILIGLSLLGLTLSTGCSDDSKAKDGVKDPEEILPGDEPETTTLKSLFEMVALGKKADLARLKSDYLKLVKDTATADEFANFEDAAGNHTLCMLVKLESKAASREILKDLLLKLSEPAAKINKKCEANVYPLKLAFDPARSGDDAEEAKEIINVLVTMGGAETIASASGLEEIAETLSSVNEKGDLDQLIEVIKHAPTLDHAIAWVVAHQGDAKVIPALRASKRVSLKDLVDRMEAAVVAPIDDAKVKVVKLLYRAYVEGDASGVKATALASEVPTSVVGDRFFHFWAQLPLDDELLAMGRDFLKQVSVGAGGGAAGKTAVLAALNEAGDGDAPLNRVLAQAKSDANNKAIKLLIEQDNTVLLSSVEPADVSKVLTADA